MNTKCRPFVATRTIRAEEITARLKWENLKRRKTTNNKNYLTESTASLTCGNKEILKAITLPGGKESKYTSRLPSVRSTRTNYQ